MSHPYDVIYHRIGIWWTTRTHKMNIVVFSQTMRNSWKRHINFSCAVGYHKVGIPWKSSHSLWELWLSILQVSPISLVLLNFSIPTKVNGKTMHFSNDKAYHKMGIWWKTTFFGKSMGTDYPGSIIDGFCCIFLCYGKLIGTP